MECNRTPPTSAFLLPGRRTDSRPLSYNLPVHVPSLGGIGDTLAYSYNTRSRSGAAETLAQWKELLGGLSDQGRMLTVEGGNAYVLGYADYLKDIPDRDLGFRFTTASVI